LVIDQYFPTVNSADRLPWVYQVVKKSKGFQTTHETFPGQTVSFSILVLTFLTITIPDAAKFGQTYLEKFGWNESQGLGASGSGRTSHIKVSQKLDMLGIGAANQRDPDGIAWKQNKDFENVLKRLNEANGVEGEGGEDEKNGKRRSEGGDIDVDKKRKKAKTSDPAAEATTIVAPKPSTPRPML
jgi:hypothetical protein